MLKEYSVAVGMVLGGTLSVVTFLAGVAALVLSYTGHVEVTREIFFQSAAAAEFAMIAAGLCGVLSLVLRRLRWLWAGLAIVAAGMMFGAAWTCGLIATFVQWGLPGAIGSVLFAGIGPIPAGFIAALVGGHWEMAFDIGMSVLLGLAAVFFSSQSEGFESRSRIKSPVRTHE